MTITTSYIKVVKYKRTISSKDAAYVISHNNIRLLRKKNQFKKSIHICVLARNPTLGRFTVNVIPTLGTSLLKTVPTLGTSHHMLCPTLGLPEGGMVNEKIERHIIIRALNLLMTKLHIVQ